MHRKRLTREESQAQTRQRLLDAAQELVAKKGIDATSLEEVAETAGYSRGAFYSNFHDKEELICAVLERVIDRSIEEMQKVFSQDLPLAERLELIRSYYIKVGCDLEGCTFFMSMQLYALRNEAVRPRIAELLRVNRGAVAEHVRRVFAELGKEPPAPPEVVAFSLIAQSQGLAISRMVDPDSMKLDQFQQALGIFFDQLIDAR